MSFLSCAFWLFLIASFVIFYSCPMKKRWIVILVANYVFYCFAGIQYIICFLYVTAVSYLCARFAGKSENRRSRVTWLFTILILAPLVTCKYLPFLTDNANYLLNLTGTYWELPVIQFTLPLGLSFYSLSALGYVLDVANGRYEAYSNPLQLAASISFFPCIVSGPIERQNKLVPQLISGRVFDYNTATYGLKLIAWGLFEKLVIADNLGLYVDKVYSDVYSYKGFPILLCVLFYSIQIYCDFSGYSYIAMGVARLFGIEVTRNFESPYFAKSLREFWRRWHISLSSWFKDYVYIPLGGNRKGKKQINVILTMLISGIWHGATWLYIIWGGLHGIGQVFEGLFEDRKRKSRVKIPSFIRIAFVFAICSVLWIFFKADTLTEAFYILSNMFSGISDFKTYLLGIDQLEIGKMFIILFAFEFAILFSFDYFSLRCDVIDKISKMKPLTRWCIYIVFILIIMQLSYKGETEVFVYAGF